MLDMIGDIVLILIMVLAIIGNYWILRKIRNGQNPPLKSDVGMLWFFAVIGILCGIAMVEVIPIFLFTALIAIEMADVMRMRGVKHSRYVSSYLQKNN
jgi:hypothetical protein